MYDDDSVGIPNILVFLSTHIIYVCLEIVMQKVRDMNVFNCALQKLHNDHTNK